MAVDKGLIQGVLESTPADLILFMLGFNDMGWFYSDAPGTIDSVDTFISNARAANPNVKIALANVPQRSFIGGREDLVENTEIYNALLPKYISQWTTEQSPIHLVELEQSYVSGFKYHGGWPSFTKFVFIYRIANPIAVPQVCLRVLRVRCSPFPATRLIRRRLRRLTSNRVGRVSNCKRILSDTSKRFQVGHCSPRGPCTRR